jgi:hypothetical protein
MTTTAAATQVRRPSTVRTLTALPGATAVVAAGAAPPPVRRLAERVA